MTASDSPDFTLSALISEFGLSTTNRDLRVLGRRLAVVVGRRSPFTHKHLNAVAHGSLAPGKDLSRAIVILLAQSDGGAGTVEIKVQSPNLDDAGTMLSPFRSRRCVDCLRKFKPNTRRRIRCYVCSPPRK